MRRRNIEQAISSQRNIRNQIVLLKQDKERVLIWTWSFLSNVLPLNRHLKRVEESLKTIVNVAAHEHFSRLLSAQEKNIKTASQMPLFSRKRYETKSVQMSIGKSLDAV